jgi:hypothetical protein
MELVVKIGSEDMKKIMVVSHERSGTHFLMNTLAQNFGYDAVDWIDLDMNLPLNYWNAENIVLTLEATFGKPVLNIFKSHHQVDFFLPVFGDLVKEFLFFYIHRNWHDVFDSFSKHLNEMNQNWFAGPASRGGAELAKLEPCGGLLRYQYYQHRTCLERWKYHVTGWFHGIPEEYRNHVHYIEYEKLDSDFKKEVKRMANFLGRTPPKIVRRPSRFENVITPEFTKETGS